MWRPQSKQPIIKQKSKFLFKLAEIYHVKLPKGVREFGLIVPLFGIVGVAVMCSDSLFPSLGAMPHPAESILSYHLEPVYNEAGAVKAYRKVSNSRQNNG